MSTHTQTSLHAALELVTFSSRSFSALSIAQETSNIHVFNMRLSGVSVDCAEGSNNFGGTRQKTDFESSPTENLTLMMGDCN